MTHDADEPEARVRVAEMTVATTGRITTTGLGSCVAIALYDAVARVGALAHVLLPDRGLARDTGNPARFAETAVPALVRAMVQRGASAERVVAKLAGGASMFDNLLLTGGVNIGERNAVAARDALRRAGIRVVATDLGGGHGRSVALRISDGVLEVRSLRAETRVL